ncbi:MAG: hypothetical protein RL885_00310 [Planctomycetota bacterium]
MMLQHLAVWTACAVLAAAPFDTIYVDVTNPNCPGTGTEADPYCSVQVAIDAASDGDTIQVAGGIYLENIDFNGKSVDLVAEPAPAVTIIDGQQNGSVIRAASGETISITGFVIRNGRSEIGGGGVLCDPCSATIANSTITSNEANFGAGVFAGTDSILATVDCEIRDNSSSVPVGNLSGGGVLGNRAELSLTRTAIVGNSTGRDFSSSSRGGGLLLSSCEAVLENCTISGNYAFGKGGGFVNNGDRLVLSGCTVAYNSQSRYHSNLNSGELLVYNSIVWGTRNVESSQTLYAYSSATTHVSYSIVEGGYPGPGNLDAAPHLTAPDIGDYRLSCDSPAIDAGANVFPPEDDDIDGQPRYVDGNSDGFVQIDMGAHEFDFQWAYQVIPSSPSSLVGFVAHAPPAQAGNTAWVFISGGDGQSTGGIPIPGDTRRLMLDPDPIFFQWLLTPPLLREVPLTGCSNGTFFVASPQPGFAGYYAGLSFDAGLNVISVTNTKRFELP